MIANALLLLCMYPILVIMYFMLANETKPKKNIILGATLPYTSLRDPRVLVICDQFKKALRKALWILALIALPCIFIPYASIAMALIINWMLPVVIVPYVIYARYRQRLLSIKKELLQGKEISQASIQVDLQASVQQPKPVSLAWHLPPLIMGMIPVIACLLSYQKANGDGWLLTTYITMALMVPLAMLLHRSYHRQNPDIVSNDSRLNAAMTRIRRRRQTQFCLWFSWFSGILCLVLWMIIEQYLSYFWGMVWMLLYTVVLTAMAFYTEFKTRRQMEQMAPGSPTDVIDEDPYWIVGQFYYNPHDKHLTKQARIGVGSTINLARPLGKALMVFLLLCLLSMPLMGLWMIGEEFTPITAEILDDTIVVRQLWQECEIPLKDIMDSTTLEERPSMGRIVGSSIGSTCKGRYDVAGHGTCRVYIRDPEGPYLLVITYDGKYLLEWSRELAAAMPILVPAIQ